MGKLYKVSGEVVDMKPANGSIFSYEELKDSIGGGWIEIVGLPDGRMIVCDEEGKLKGFAVNASATEVWVSAFGPTDVLVGDILIADAGEVE